MATRLRTLGQAVLTGIDRWYRHRFELQPMGAMLLLGCASYRGSSRRFSDGTHLQKNQRIGVLHFDNARIATLAVDTRQCAGVRFARLFRESLRSLAERIQTDPALRDVLVYHGLTWFKAHGRQVGFVSEPVPFGLKRWWLSAYFHLLSWGFSPVTKTRAITHEPRMFWITRNDLIKYFDARVA